MTNINIISNNESTNANANPQCTNSEQIIIDKLTRDNLVDRLTRRVLNGCCLQSAVHELDKRTRDFVDNITDEEVNMSRETWQKYIQYLREVMLQQHLQLFSIDEIV